MATEPLEDLIEEFNEAHGLFTVIVDDVNKRSNRTLKAVEIKTLTNIKNAIRKSVLTISNLIKPTNNITNKLDKILDLIEKPNDQNFPSLPAHNSPTKLNLQP